MNTSKKIAIIASSAPPEITGGISSAHYYLYKMLKEKGFIVKILTYTDHKPVSQSEDDISRHGTPLLLLKAIQLISKGYHIFLRLLERFEFGYQFPYILESAMGALRINKTLRKFQPDIIILPDYGAPGYFIEKEKDCKIIFISHHNPSRFAKELPPGLFSHIDAGLAMSIEKKTLRKADKVVCPSVYMKNVFAETHEFERPVAVIPNLIDVNFMRSIPPSDIHAKLGLHQDAPVIYFPSAGNRIKGSRFVFDIIRRLSAVYKEDIGYFLSDTIFDKLLLKELTCVPGNARIFNPGRLSYSDNIAMLKCCSFCISPTLTESFGMAILEANFCGLPVVTFDVGGNADIITNGANGFLVKNMDIDSLVSYSKQLLDVKYLDELRQKTLQLVNDKFVQEPILHRYLTYFLT